MNNNRILHKYIAQALGSAFLALNLAACLPQTSQWDGNEVVMRNSVELVRIPHDVVFAADLTSMNPQEIKRLEGFLDHIDLTYGDKIFLDAPVDRQGNMTSHVQSRTQFIRNHLQKLGLDVADTVSAYGDAPSSNSVKVIVERYVVTPPGCPDWRQKAWPNYANAPTANLGCANQTALGLMVANPKDLVEGQDYIPSGSRTSDPAIKALHDGKVKWKAKTNETASVSQ